jgi:hypothetical protein
VGEAEEVVVVVITDVKGGVEGDLDVPTTVGPFN